MLQILMLQCKNRLAFSTKSGAKLLIFYQYAKKSQFLFRTDIQEHHSKQHERQIDELLLFRFFSWKKRAPKRKETTTLARRIIDTMETMESGRLSA